MTNWWWVLVFGGIAIAALVLFAVLGLGLWRKSKALLKDLGTLSATLGTLESAIGAGAPGSDVPVWTPEPLDLGRHRSE